MSKDKNIAYDQIEEYLKGTLDEKALAAFEEKLRSDPVLQEEVTLVQKIRSANKDAGLASFEKELDGANASFFGLHQKGKISSLPKWIWGVAILLLLSLLFFLGRQLFNPPSPIDPDKLYAQYAQRDFSFQEMSSEVELGEIQSLLETQQYSAALLKLDTYLSDHPNAADVRLAKGIALLETEQFEESLSIFQTLAEQLPLYKTEATWQIGLLYLKKGQLADSLAALKQIPKDSSRYPEARQLIQLLEKRIN